MNVAIYNKSDGVILRRIDAPANQIVHQAAPTEDFYLNCPPEATHIINNEPITIITPPTEAEIIASLTAAVQWYLDSEVHTHNYDGILSLCSYATSLDPIFNAEGQAGVVWRDAVWRKSSQVMEEVKAGTRAVPTSEELIAELPLMVWPI